MHMHSTTCTWGGDSGCCDNSGECPHPLCIACSHSELVKGAWSEGFDGVLYDVATRCGLLLVEECHSIHTILDAVRQQIPTVTHTGSGRVPGEGDISVANYRGREESGRVPGDWR